MSLDIVGQSEPISFVSGSTSASAMCWAVDTQLAFFCSAMGENAPSVSTLRRTQVCTIRLLSVML